MTKNNKADCGKIQLSFQHIGIAVSQIERALAFYESVFDFDQFLRRKAKHLSTPGNVEIIFLRNGDFVLEIIGPLNTELSKNRTHIALAVNSASEFAKRLNESNVPFESFHKPSGEFDFIRLEDPEMNTWEISQK